MNRIIKKLTFRVIHLLVLRRRLHRWRKLRERAYSDHFDRFVAELASHGTGDRVDDGRDRRIRHVVVRDGARVVLLGPRA